MAFMQLWGKYGKKALQENLPSVRQALPPWIPAGSETNLHETALEINSIQVVTEKIPCHGKGNCRNEGQRNQVPGKTA